MELLKRMWTQVITMWERLSSPYRVALACITALLIFSIVWGLTSALARRVDACPRPAVWTSRIGSCAS